MAPAADCHRSTPLMRSEEGRHGRVLRLAVGRGLAEPVLVASEVFVQLGPPLDLQPGEHPAQASRRLHGDEVRHVVFGSGPGLFGTRPLRRPGKESTGA